jgi:hypothetical protein
MSNYRHPRNSKTPLQKAPPSDASSPTSIPHEKTKNRNGGAFCLLVDQDQVHDVWKDLLSYAVGEPLNCDCGFRDPDEEVTRLIVGAKWGNCQRGIEIWTSQTGIDAVQIQTFLVGVPSALRRVNHTTFKAHYRSPILYHDFVLASAQ